MGGILRVYTGRGRQTSVLSAVTLLIFHPLADTVTVGLGGGAGSSCTSLFIIPQEIEGCDLSEPQGEDWALFQQGEGRMGAGQGIDGRKLIHKARGRQAAVAARNIIKWQKNSILSMSAHKKKKKKLRVLIKADTTCHNAGTSSGAEALRREERGKWWWDGDRQGFIYFLMCREVSWR